MTINNKKTNKLIISYIQLLAEINTLIILSLNNLNLFILSYHNLALKIKFPIPYILYSIF